MEKEIKRLKLIIDKLEYNWKIHQEMYYFEASEEWANLDEKGRIYLRPKLVQEQLYHEGKINQIFREYNENNEK